MSSLSQGRRRERRQRRRRETQLTLEMTARPDTSLAADWLVVRCLQILLTRSHTSSNTPSTGLCQMPSVLLLLLERHTQSRSRLAIHRRLLLLLLVVPLRGRGDVSVQTDVRADTTHTATTGDGDQEKSKKITNRAPSSLSKARFENGYRIDHNDESKDNRGSSSAEELQVYLQARKGTKNRRRYQCRNSV